MTRAPIVHPAPFSAPILGLLAELIPDDSMVLDPFAGIGRIHQLDDPDGSGVRTFGVEIEPEWAALDPRTIRGDATALPEHWSARFDAVVTSPCYGNRFADSHTACDGSTRRSYTHDLRAFTGDPARKLDPNNAGAMHWGEKYRLLHFLAWREAFRVLKPGGLLILNVSDHQRKKAMQGVPAWHRDELGRIGFDYLTTYEVTTRRQKRGANRERAEYEEVQVHRKPLSSG